MNAINISTNSLLYRFLDTNFISAQWYIPHNLCPFMRKVVAAICINIFVFSLLAVAVSGMLLSLIAIFIDYSLWGPVWEILVIIGGSMWGLILILLGLAAWFTLLEKYHFLSKASDKVSSLNAVQVTAKWWQAAHEKVCPSLTFRD